MNCDLLNQLSKTSTMVCSNESAARAAPTCRQQLARQAIILSSSIHRSGTYADSSHVSSKHICKICRHIQAYNGLQKLINHTLIHFPSSICRQQHRKLPEQTDQRTKRGTSQSTENKQIKSTTYCLSAHYPEIT